MLNEFLDWLTELIFPPQWATPDGTGLAEVEPLIPQWMAFGTTGSRGVRVAAAKGSGKGFQIVGGSMSAGDAKKFDALKKAAAGGDSNAQREMNTMRTQAQRTRLETQQQRKADQKAAAAERRKANRAAGAKTQKPMDDMDRRLAGIKLDSKLSSSAVTIENASFPSTTTMPKAGSASATRAPRSSISDNPKAGELMRSPSGMKRTARSNSATRVTRSKATAAKPEPTPAASPQKSTAGKGFGSGKGQKASKPKKSTRGSQMETTVTGRRQSLSQAGLGYGVNQLSGAKLDRAERLVSQARSIQGNSARARSQRQNIARDLRDLGVTVDSKRLGL